MTDLKRLQAELERQDRELNACFDQLRALDPDLVLAVSPEWLGEIRGEEAPPAPAVAWAARA